MKLLIIKFVKFQEFEEAIKLADEALNLKPSSYEAYYARAKARIDIDFLDEALADAQEALHIIPLHNREDRRVLTAMRDEIISRLEGSGMGTSKGYEGGSRCRLRASVDTLTEL